MVIVVVNEKVFAKPFKNDSEYFFGVDIVLRERMNRILQLPAKVFITFRLHELFVPVTNRTTLRII